MACLPARWFFNFQKWTPTKEQWNSAIHSIQPEEKIRIEKFVFKEDTKSALAGRLLLRKVVSSSYQLPNNCFTLKRTSHGRPFLEKVHNASHTVSLQDFNVSHQGDYCVLAAESSCQVGIDVMKRCYSGGNTVPEFFRLMTRKFTRKEWDYICGPVPEAEQLKRFFRLWSLKESFVKADGRGLGYDLQRLSFMCNTPTLIFGQSVTDTKLSIDGIERDDWKFEETLLDEMHNVSVALSTSVIQEPATSFSEFTISELLCGLTSIAPVDEEAWQNFNDKPSKTS